MVQARQLIFRAGLLALCLFFLIPFDGFGQEPNQRELRHIRKVVKGVSAVRPYVANAVDFDGSSDNIERGADLTGVADGKLGTLSMWLRTDGGNGIQLNIIRTLDPRNFRFHRSSDNTFRLRIRNAADATRIQVDSSSAFTASSAWIHVLAAWDANTPEAHLFIDGVNDEAGGSTEIDDTLDYTNGDWGIGASVGGANRYNGCIAELYLNLSEFVDITQASERAKFRDDSGRPIDLGSDGSTPTGTAAIVYLNGDSTNFQTNQGTGGNFSVTGSLTDCSTSPTD